MAKGCVRRNCWSNLARSAWWAGLLAVVLGGVAAAQSPADLGTEKIAAIVKQCAEKECTALKEDRPRLSCVFQCALKRASSTDAGGVASFVSMESLLSDGLSGAPSKMVEPDLRRAYVGPRVLSDEEKLKIGNEAANRKFIRAKELDLLQSRGLID